MALGGKRVEKMDDAGLRAQVAEQLGRLDQKALTIWAFGCARRILKRVNPALLEEEPVREGFAAGEAWLEGALRVEPVRRAALRVHALARSRSVEAEITALRSLGQALSVAHVRGHAIGAADYAVKALSFLGADAPSLIHAERTQQIRDLKGEAEDKSGLR